MSEISTQIKLQILITERDGMIAENNTAIYYNQQPNYAEDSFCIVAGKMEELLSEYRLEQERNNKRMKERS